VCNIVFTIADKEFQRVAVAIPGELINWTPCFHVPYHPVQEMEFVMHQMKMKFSKPEEDKRYLPPTMRDGTLVSGLMVIDGIVVSSHNSTIERSEPRVGKSSGNKQVEQSETAEDDVEKVETVRDNEVLKVDEPGYVVEEEDVTEVVLRENEEVKCLGVREEKASA